MDRIIIYKNNLGEIRRHHMGGFSNYKEIKKCLERNNIKDIISVKKYKLCSHCKDGYLEVDDKRGKEILK